MYHKNIILLGDLNLDFKKVDARRDAIEAEIKAINDRDLKRRAKIYFPFIDVHPARQEVFRSNPPPTRINTATIDTSARHQCAMARKNRRSTVMVFSDRPAAALDQHASSRAASGGYRHSSTGIRARARKRKGKAGKLRANQVQGPVICGLSRAVAADIDACGKALANAKRSRIHTGLGISDIHIAGKFSDERYGKTLAEKKDKAIQMAVESVKRARRACCSGTAVAAPPKWMPTFQNEILSAPHA